MKKGNLQYWNSIQIPTKFQLKSEYHLVFPRADLYLHKSEADPN